MKFSQRKGYTPASKKIQKESMDNVLRNKLWTAIDINFFQKEDILLLNYSSFATEIRYLWINFFEQPIDTLSPYMFEFKSYVRKYFYNCSWYEAYDFIEAINEHLNEYLKSDFIEMVNIYLEQEMSAYRLVGDKIVELTKEEEIEAIEEATKKTKKIQPAHIHLREAQSKLFDRKKPDYRNSIKESISAVEAMCKTITNKKKATLTEAIKSLENSGINLHPALKEAWSNLYGYTSDHGGIRHALSEAENIGFAEAKYMLVCCSTFINYLLDLMKNTR